MYQRKTGKNIQRFMYGNNLEATKFYRMTIPLTLDGTQAAPGVKFYFPETPVLEKKTIVGIEGHVAPSIAGSLQGDLETLVGGTNVNQFFASYIFMTIFDDEDGEKFYNVPFKSLCLFNTILVPTNVKRVHPYIGRIKTRKSYLSFPPNTTLPITPNLIVTLTFFYNQ